MPINKGYAAYQNTNIKTASQGKLVVLLYEAAVKNLKNAESQGETTSMLPIHSAH